MNLLRRICNIILKPAAEWRTIASETVTGTSLFATYIVPLSALALLAIFISESLIGFRVIYMPIQRTPMDAGVWLLLLGLLLSSLVTWLLSCWINCLAVRFGGEKNSIQALKLAAYASTPVWLISVFEVVPLAMGFSLIAWLYSVYLLYLGLPLLMKVSRDMLLRYTLAVAAGAAVLLLSATLLSAVTVGVVAPAIAIGRTMTQENATLKDRVASAVPIVMFFMLDKALKYAMKRDGIVLTLTQPFVAPVKLEQLLPETLAGLPRVRVSSEGSVKFSYACANSYAEYSDGQANIILALTDFDELTPVIASWVGEPGESTPGTAMPKASLKGGDWIRIGLVDGRYSRHKWGQSEMQGTYQIAVADRFMVEIDYTHFPQGKIASVLDPVLFERLQALKDEHLQAQLQR